METLTAESGRPQPATHAPASTHPHPPAQRNPSPAAKRSRAWAGSGGPSPVGQVREQTYQGHTPAKPGTASSRRSGASLCDDRRRVALVPLQPQLQGQAHRDQRSFSRSIGQSGESPDRPTGEGSTEPHGAAKQPEAPNRKKTEPHGAAQNAPKSSAPKTQPTRTRGSGKSAPPQERSPHPKIKNDRRSAPPKNS